MSESNHEAAAEFNFLSGKNCAQAVFCAFANDFGLTNEVAAKVACGLGGGVGRMREVCGAVTGAAMVLGLHFGEDKMVVYPHVQNFCRRFREEAGSIICAALLEGKIPRVEVGGAPEDRTEQYYAKRPCVELVKLATRLLEEEISK